MIWILLSLLAPFLWAVSNLVDSELVDKHLKDPLAIIAIAGLFNIIPSVFFFAFTGFPVPPAPVILLSILGGALYIYGLIPYLYALKSSSATSVLLMWNLYPVIAAVMAWFILSERLGMYQYVAVGVLVLSSMIAAYERSSGKIAIYALALTILGTIIEAAQSIVEEHVYNIAAFWDAFPWVFFGGFVAAVTLFIVRPSISKSLLKTVKTDLRKVFILNETLDTAAGWSKSLALSLGPVSLVNALGGFQPFFIMGLLFLPFVRKHVGERQHLTKGQMFQFILAGLLGVIGVWLIARGA